MFNNTLFIGGALFCSSDTNIYWLFEPTQLKKNTLIDWLGGIVLHTPLYQTSTWLPPYLSELCETTEPDDRYA